MKFTFLFVFFGACFLFSLLGEYFYIADLLSSFYLQYFIAALIFTTYYAFRGFKKHFYFALIILLAIWTNIGSVHFPDTRVIKAGPAPQHIRVMQFNVLYANTQLKEAVEEIVKADADILVFQEVTPRVVAEFAKLKEKYPNYIESPQDDAFGSMVMTRLPIIKAERKNLPNSAVDYTEVNILLKNGSVLKLYELHTLPPVGAGHHRERNGELEAIARLLSSDAATNKIIAGDFNITPYSAHFKSFVKNSGMVASVGFKGTWPSKLPAIFRIPIDHLLVSDNIGIKNRVLGVNLGSDHLPVITDLIIYR